MYIYTSRLDGRESACIVGDPGWIPGLVRSPGEWNGYPFQNSCLENFMNRGAWQPTVHGVNKESDVTEQLTEHIVFMHYICFTYIYIYIIISYIFPPKYMLPKDSNFCQFCITSIF